MDDFFDGIETTERQAMANKLSYWKNDVLISCASLSVKLCGFGFETIASDMPIFGIIVNGKLRRSDRRATIKILLIAIENNLLEEMTLKGKSRLMPIKGAAIFAKKEGEK